MNELIGVGIFVKYNFSYILYHLVLVHELSFTWGYNYTIYNLQEGVMSQSTTFVDQESKTGFSFSSRERIPEILLYFSVRSSYRLVVCI